MYVYSGTRPLNFQCILMQVFDTPKLNVSHSTENNSSQRGGLWFEDPCATSLSVTQNKCWLVAESNLQKKIQSSTPMYHTPLKLKNKINKMYCCFKLKIYKNV